MVAIHICFLVKFLAKLMVTLENNWNSLLLWEASAFSVSDKMAGDLHLKSAPGLPWLVFMFLAIEFPCTFPLYKNIALTLNTLIYIDLIFSKSKLILSTNNSSGSQKLRAAISALGLPGETLVEANYLCLFSHTLFNSWTWGSGWG